MIEVGDIINKINLEILKILASEEDFISAHAIAERLQVSRRTIFNNIGEVKRICNLYKAEIISKKSKGYKLENSNELTNFLNEQDSNWIQIYNKERILYTIYLLLSEENPIHISELADILYLSRPTVYKLIKEITLWFKNKDIELIMTRNGIYIQYGERRYREALKCWISEVLKYFDLEKNKLIMYDPFKLKKSVQEYLIDDFIHIKTIIELICKEFHIYCSTHEMINLAILLEIIIYRSKEEHFVKLSNRLLKLIIEIYTEDKIKKIGKIIKKQLNIRLEYNEIVYLIVSILINGDFEDETFLDNRISNLSINNLVYYEIENYIKKNLNINCDSLKEFIKDVDFILKREILFQIKGDNGTSAKYYNEMMKKIDVHVTTIVNQIYLIITKYYTIIYHEKMICNLIFCLLNLLLKSMKKLKIVLYHNCDVFEIRYVLSILSMIPIISIVFVSDNEQEIEEYYQSNDVDLVITTCNIKAEYTKALELSKICSIYEINKLYNDLNKIYQLKNLNKFFINI